MRKEANLRILLDQGTPVMLRHALKTHTVSTAFELGWSALKNGELLTIAETQFDIFVTTDKNLCHQQNLVGRQLAIIVLRTAICKLAKTPESYSQYRINYQ